MLTDRVLRDGSTATRMCCRSRAVEGRTCVPRNRLNRYLVNRYYDPSTAQFLAVDPLVGQTGQAFSYANDDPVN